MHGFPYACISLGLIDQRVPVLGVIYNPFLDHLYTGVRGAGAFLHTRTQPQPQRLPLAPARPLPSLGGALIAVEWGSDRTQEPIRAKTQSFARLAGAPPHGVMAHSLRSVGSAALNFALVAQGALDAYWFVSRSSSPPLCRCSRLIGDGLTRACDPQGDRMLVRLSPCRPPHFSLLLGCTLNVDRFSRLQVMGRMRACATPHIHVRSSAPIASTGLNFTGGHRDRARGRRLRHRLQGRAARWRGNRDDPDGSTLPRHPRRGGNTCAYCLITFDTHAAHMYGCMHAALSCRAGREQPRRAEAPRAGILRYRRGHPTRRVSANPLLLIAAFVL